MLDQRGQLLLAPDGTALVRVVPVG